MSKKNKKKSKAKTRRPLTIWVRGEDLRVEATFSDERLSELLADMIKRLNGATPPEDPAPISELVAEFGKSLRKDQLEMMLNTFDMQQKLLFMEIMNLAGNTQQDHAS